MHELAQQPLGGVLIWVVAVGMFLLVVWRLVEAAAGHRDEDGGRPAPQAPGLARQGRDVRRRRLLTPSRWRMSRRLEGAAAAPTPPRRSWSWPGGQLIVALVGLADDRLRRRTWCAAPGPRSSASTSTGEGQGGDAGTGLHLVRQGGLHRPRAWPSWSIGGLFVYAGAHPRRQEVRRPRRRAAQGARAAVRARPAGPDRGRHRLLRAVLLRPGPPPVPLSRTAAPVARVDSAAVGQGRRGPARGPAPHVAEQNRDASTAGRSAAMTTNPVHTSETPDGARRRGGAARPGGRTAGAPGRAPGRTGGPDPGPVEARSPGAGAATAGAVPAPTGHR